jgi:hypothetical protein
MPQLSPVRVVGLSRRARAVIMLACFAAIVGTALLANNLRDVLASMALGLLLALVVQLAREVRR